MLLLNLLAFQRRNYTGLILLMWLVISSLRIQRLLVIQSVWNLKFALPIIPICKLLARIDLPGPHGTVNLVDILGDKLELGHGYPLSTLMLSICCSDSIPEPLADYRCSPSSLR